MDKTSNTVNVNTQNRNIFAYDLIRVIALIMIVYYHMNVELLKSGSASPMIITMMGKNVNIGQVGAGVFLILSGAVQCISRERNPSLKRYYIRRWISIMPMFYLAYVLGHLIAVLHKAATGISVKLIWTLLGIDGYLSMLGVSTSYIVGEWFLGMLLFLYAVFPLLYYLARKFPLLLLGLLAVLYAVNVIFVKSVNPEINLFVRMFEFGVGIYLYLYRETLFTIRGLFLVLPVLILFMVLSIPIPPVICITVLGITLFYCLYVVGEKLEYKLAPAITRLVRFFAGLSYPVILIHHIVILTSLESRQNLDMGYRGYLHWSVYVLLLIFACSLILKWSYSRLTSSARRKAK